MKCNVPVAEATNDETVLPERVQDVLGQLVGAAKEGLLALSVEVGLGVLRELLEEEVDEVVGPKGKWKPDRTAVRHGHENGEVTLGGRRVQVSRPRVRSADGESKSHGTCSSRCSPASPRAAFIARVSRSARQSRAATKFHGERDILGPGPAMRRRS